MVQPLNGSKNSSLSSQKRSASKLPCLFSEPVKNCVGSCIWGNVRRQGVTKENPLHGSSTEKQRSPAGLYRENPEGGASCVLCGVGSVRLLRQIRRDSSWLVR